MTTQAPVLPLEKAWQFQADSGIKEPGVTAAYDQIYFTTKEGQIYALDATTGQTKWAFKMEKTLQLPLTTADELVFAASKDKNLYVINAKNGQKHWQFSTGKDFVEWTYADGPATANGTVYIATRDKKLYALDTQIGKVKWQFQAGGEILTPAIINETIYFGSKDKKVYALNTKNGQKIWETKTGHEKHTRPIITENKLLIAGDDDLYAINPNNGTILWEVKKALYYQTMPAVAGGLAYTTKNEAIIDLATGKEVDKIREAADCATFVSDENLYVKHQAKITLPLHNAEFIFAFDLTTRKEKWQACLNGMIPFWEIKEPYIYAVDMWNNKLIILNTSKFTKRWETDSLPRGEDIGKPLIAYGMVFISCGKTVYAYRSSKNPAIQRSLEIGDEISPSPKYLAETLRDEIIWPNCCCLCCGPAEVYVELEAEFKIMGLQRAVKVRGVPYCKECYDKTTKLIGREKPGVEIIRFPPTYAFRNEKYWGMFMEVNRLR